MLVIFSWSLSSRNLPGISTYGALTKNDILKEVNKDIKKLLKIHQEASLHESSNGE